MSARTKPQRNLEDFDEYNRKGRLPDKVEHRGVTLLRLPEVVKRVGLCRSSIYLMMASTREDMPRFPPSVPVGKRAVAWPSTAIDDFVQACIDAGERK